MVAADSIAGYLKEATAPVALKKLEKYMRARSAEVAAALSEAVQTGAVFEWPKHRGARRYWNREPAEVIREEVLRVSGETALTRKELVREVAKSAHNCGNKAAENAIAALAKEGALKTAKTVSLTPLYFREDTPHAILAPSIAALRERLARYGVDWNESPAPALPAAAPSGDLHARVLDTIHRLQPSPGVPVSTPRLRAACPGISKADFDAAVLSLADRQDIYLTTHDHGWALPEAERDQLVWDGGQKLYVAVTTRN